MCAKLLQPCLDPTDCSSAKLFCPRDFQARILSGCHFPPGLSYYRGATHISLNLLHWQVGSVPLMPPGKPPFCFPSTLMPTFHVFSLPGRKQEDHTDGHSHRLGEIAVNVMCVESCRSRDTIPGENFSLSAGTSAPDDINSNH